MAHDHIEETEPRSRRDLQSADKAADEISGAMQGLEPGGAPYALTINLTDSETNNLDDIGYNISVYPVHINTYSNR